MPKVLVNATTLVVGGGVQIGISFVEYASRFEHKRFDFIFAVSRQIYDGLSTELQQDERLNIVDVSPARIVKGYKSRLQLKHLEYQFYPDIVYTLGLPSYVRFNRPEVGRYTNPWEIFPSSLAWSKVPIIERVRILLKSQYRMYWARRAEYFETQTEAAKSGIIKKLHVPSQKIKVIPNSPNQRYLHNGDATEGKVNKANGKNVLCLSAAYRHKNLSIIPEVAEKLKNNHNDPSYLFILTIPFESQIYKEIKTASTKLGVTEMIKNIGPLSIDQCIAQYKKANVIFLPTLLEVFSATYLEAMAMSKPIITPDLDFARDICGEAAMYYSPISPTSAAEALMLVINNTDLYGNLVRRGKDRLALFPDPDVKYSIVLDWLENITIDLSS